MDRRTLGAFRNTIRDYYRQSGRHGLPWRKTKDPYRILVSEVMLQQTQVSRVLKKYQEFLKAFPTLHDLACASAADVVRVWQGMGYNRRALTLHHAAREIVSRFSGRIPRDSEVLAELPGIGPYTARAICIFAFNRPEICIETNIRRVYIHHFFPRARNVPDRKILPFIEATLDQNDPRTWYWALMDYGAALVRRIPNPNRRSRHYIRQEAFEGSRRQVRGAILKKLCANGAITVAALAKTLPREKVKESIFALEREGFLKKEGRVYVAV